MEKSVYTRKELMAVLQCGLATVDKLIRSGRLECIRLGARRVVVPVTAVERFLRGER